MMLQELSKSGQRESSATTEMKLIELDLGISCLPSRIEQAAVLADNMLPPAGLAVRDRR